MLVSSRMKRDVITIGPEQTIKEAMVLLDKHDYEALPVIEQGKLVGVLSVWSIFKGLSNSMLSGGSFNEHTLVKDIMNPNPVTINPYEVLEEAAYLMEIHDVWSVSVVDDDNELVGFLTEWDIYDVFVEMLGLREKGTRLTITTEDRPGRVAAVCQAIAEEGINIISIAAFRTENPRVRDLVVRVAVEDAYPLVEKLRTKKFRITHVSQVWQD